MTNAYVTWIPVVLVALMTAATILLGVYATRQAKTASDFFVAGRSVSVGWNASAISGEYLSAASFMGIAGLLMKNGYDALWYPACYATGYLFLLLFIAGPLRRFGAYTIPDFAEGRFNSPAFRRVAVIFVLFIGFFYTMPQMKGAGVVMGTILNWPYWAGIVLVGVVITFNVAFGGMKGITFVQAFQYWAKLFAISLPVFVLASVVGGYSKNLSDAAAPDATPRVVSPTTVKVKGDASLPSQPRHVLGPRGDQGRFPRRRRGHRSAPSAAKPGEDPTQRADLATCRDHPLARLRSPPPAPHPRTQLDRRRISGEPSPHQPRDDSVTIPAGRPCGSTRSW